MNLILLVLMMVPIQQSAVELNTSKIDTISRPYLRSTASGAHCGIYCVSAALTFFKIKPDLGRLLNGKYISSRNGSSAEDLVKCLSDHELHASHYKNLNISFLKSCDHPVLLHLAQSRRHEGSFHWIVYLGDQNGKALICDPPRGIETVEYASIQAKWTGSGILVDNKPILRTSTVSGYTQFLPWLCAVLTFAFLTQRFEKRSSTNKFGILFCLVITLSFLSHVFVPNGFWNNLSAVQMIAANYQDQEFDIIEFEDLPHYESDNDALLVDARMPSQFQKGHIPGAVNFPVDSSLGEFEDGIEKTNSYSTIVVYCQSESCTWDMVVANRISAVSNKEVLIYSAGWNDWRRRRAESHFHDRRKKK